MEDEQMKEKYMQFQMLQQQLQQIGEHTEALNQRMAEVDQTIEAIKGLGESKVNSEMLAPIANGIFVKSELKDNKKLVLNVGADVTVEKEASEVIKLLEEQKTSMIAGIAEAETLQQELQKRFMEIFQGVEESVEDSE